MDRNIIGIYSMLLANLQMNYQIMSALVEHNNPILKEWKIYIDDLSRTLEKISETY